MNRRTIIKKIGLFALLASLLFTTGCTQRTFERLLMDETERSEDAHANPFFWEDATPINGYSNLYELTPFSFTGKPYNNVMSLGENILVIGEGFYTSVTNSTQNADSSDINYYFSLYDPWNNRITASLLPKDVNCDSYQIAGDHLLLFNSRKSTLSVYDSSLSLEHTYSYEDTLSNTSMSFFAPYGEDFLYTDDSDGNLLKIDISGNTLSSEVIPLPFYGVTILDTSPDATKLLIHGIDASTLKYTTAVISLSDYSVEKTFEGSTYFKGYLGEDSLLVGKDSTSDSWSYYNGSDTASYLALNNDYQNLDLLPDGNILIKKTTSRKDKAICYGGMYCYSPSGECISSFKYNLGYTDSDDMMYLSSQGAYLESCNCYFLLIFDANCNPSFLIWDLNKTGKSQKALTVYDTREALAGALAETQEGSDWETTEDASSYGNTVTALEDPDHYDWGDLADIHKEAEALEDQYQVEIYLGPEIPEQIDVFYTEQNKSSSYLRASLESLNSILADYPPNFFQQLCYGELQGIRIYLTGNIHGVSSDSIADPSGFVNNINNYVVMVLDVNYNWDWSYTVNHEISHMIDRRLEFYHLCNPDSVFSDANWSKNNPDEFVYSESYKAYDTNETYETYSDYFIDSYGTTFATEDRAEIFGTALSDYEDGFLGDSKFSTDSCLRQKLSYYCEAIRDGFDTTEWPDTLPWEAVLNE